MLRILRRHFPSLAGLSGRRAGPGLSAGTPTTCGSRLRYRSVGRLLDEGAEVRAYDPIATESARTAFAGLNIKLCEDMAEAVQDVEAVLLVTRWDEFAHVPALIARQPVPALARRRQADDSAGERCELRRHRTLRRAFERRDVDPGAAAGLDRR